MTSRRQRPNRRRFNWHVPLLLCTALLSSCAHISSPQPTTSPIWQLSGKLAVSSNQASGSGQLNWLIYPQRFAISLRGPLGYGSARLTGTPQQAILEQGGKRISGSVDQLSREWLGSELPLQALQYWADGKTAPSTFAVPKDLLYNDQRQLLSFTQAGWQLRLSRYPDAQKSSRPNKITGQQGDQRFTLIIQSRGDRP